MKHYESSMRTNTKVEQAHDSVTRLHNSVSQGLSHPTEQTIEQAENSLEHAEQAVRQAPYGARDEQGVELAEEILAEEKDRLAVLKGQKSRSEL